MDKKSLEHRLIEVIGYAAVSARNLIDETPLYGPIRLLEVIVRLLDLMDELGLQPRGLEMMKEHARSGGRALTQGEDRLVAVLDALVRDLLDAMDV